MIGNSYAKEAHLRICKNYENFLKKDDISKYFSLFVILFPIVRILFFFILTRLFLSDTFINFLFSDSSTPSPYEASERQVIFIVSRMFIGGGLGLHCISLFITFLLNWDDLCSHDNYYPIYKINLKNALRLNKVLDNFKVHYFTYTHSYNSDIKGVTIIFKDELIGATRVTNLWLQATLDYFFFIEKIRLQIEKHDKRVERKKSFKEKRKNASKDMIQKIINELEEEQVK